MRPAYGSAVRDEARLVGTIDALAHATVRSRRLPLSLEASVLGDLRGIAESGSHPSGRYGPGEAVARATPHPEVDAILREVEWKVRRLAAPIVDFAGPGHLLLATVRLRDCSAARYLVANNVRRAEMIADLAMIESVLGCPDACVPRTWQTERSGVISAGATVGTAADRGNPALDLHQNLIFNSPEPARCRLSHLTTRLVAALE
ncbi:hypothetical protein AB0J82_14100 [Asanoa sp. NPDC049518]|uniref:hypothetical protein n=1 Tax=unclassified Asanoa TaxID=2685164 RepID=UPI003434CAD0